jgi:hypothetical protein
MLAVNMVSARPERDVLVGRRSMPATIPPTIDHTTGAGGRGQRRPTISTGSSAAVVEKKNSEITASSSGVPRWRGGIPQKVEANSTGRLSSHCPTDPAYWAGMDPCQSTLGDSVWVNAAQGAMSATPASPAATVSFQSGRRKSTQSPRPAARPMAPMWVSSAPASPTPIVTAASRPRDSAAHIAARAKNETKPHGHV